MSAAALIRVRGLGKVYPNGYRALTNVDLDVQAGEFVVVIGEVEGEGGGAPWQIDFGWHAIGLCKGGLRK